MKVISVGNHSHVFPMRVICKQVTDEYGFSYGDAVDFCGSELEIEASDIRKRSWYKYPETCGEDYGITCPICKGFVPIKKKLLPKFVLENAEPYVQEMTKEKEQEDKSGNTIDLAMIQGIEKYLKENSAYIISSIDGEGNHVGRFKEFVIDANGDLIISTDIDSESCTG